MKSLVIVRGSLTICKSSFVVAQLERMLYGDDLALPCQVATSLPSHLRSEEGRCSAASDIEHAAAFRPRGR